VRVVLSSLVDTNMNRATASVVGHTAPCKGNGPRLLPTGKTPNTPKRRQDRAARACQLQHERAARADLRPARQEVAPDQRLQHAALAAALAAHDRDLRQVQLEVQRDLRARAPPPSAF